MRILLLTSLEKNPAFEATLADVARRNAWKLTVVRPGSQRMLRLVALIFGLICLALMLVSQHHSLPTTLQLSYYLLRVRFHPPLWGLICALVAMTAALTGLHYGAARLMTLAQMRATVRAAHSVVEQKKPNMVVALGYGCVVVLENEVLRQLPLLLLSPYVIEYSKQLSATAEEQTLLNLEDSPFTYVTYDTTQTPTTIKESMLLADTAEPGSCATDLLCVRYADESKLERIITYSFVRGWTAIAEREGIRIEYQDTGSSLTHLAPPEPDPDMVPRVIVDDELCSKFFFRDVRNGVTNTEWLSEDDLGLLLNLPNDREQV